MSLAAYTYDYTDLGGASPVLSAGHAELKDTLRRFALENLRPAALELDRLNPEAVLKPGSLFWHTMRKLHEQGYHTLLIPKALGGLGLDPLSIHIVMEELAYASLGFASALGVESIAGFIVQLCARERPELETAFITPFVHDKECRHTVCLAITEPAHGSDVLMPGTPCFHNPGISHQVVGRKQGTDYILNGQKSAWVSCGPTADKAAVFFGVDPSQGMAGGAIALVDLKQKGVKRGKAIDKLGLRELPQGELYFDDAVVPEEYLLCDQGAYEKISAIILGLADVGMSAAALGGARAAFEEALSYARQRIQGGRPLCDHQAVQYKLANMFIGVEAARQFSRAVMNYNLTQFPPRSEYSIAAKIFCTKKAFDVANDAVQIHGGLGLSKESFVEKLFRDIRAGLLENGSNDSLTIATANHILFGGTPY